MADSYVCSGATMKCTMGTSQAKLTVLPTRTVFLTGKPQANISDHLSMVNLAPFGNCRSMGFPATASATAAAQGTLTPMPCMHNTPFPWMGGKNDYIIKGDPALLKSSTCQCMWGGTISLVTDGQSPTESPDLTKCVPKQFAKGQSEFKKIVPSTIKDDGIESDFESYEDSTDNSENGSSNQNENKKEELSNISSQNGMISPTKVDISMKIAESVLANTWKNYSDEEKKRIISMANEMPGNLNTIEKLKKAENCLELEKALGVTKGKPMTIEEADKQSANPNHVSNAPKYIDNINGSLFHYVKDGKDIEVMFDGNSDLFIEIEGKWYFYDKKEKRWYPGKRCSRNPDYAYSVNCATCSAAYALRLLGFDVTAKGNTVNTLNKWLSESHSFDIWKNADGTKAEPLRVTDWMKKNDIKQMTGDDYKNYFNETCKEQGVYIVTVKWKEKEVVDKEGKIKLVSSGAHATILQRDVDGKLYYIEPQVYVSSKTTDGRRNIDDLVYASNGDLKLTPNPPSEKGIMRVDNKLFVINNTSEHTNNTILFNT